MGFLLSIELREGDRYDNEAGEIVVLDQCWCASLNALEFELHGGGALARFEEAAIAFMKDRTRLSDRSIDADVRPKGAA